MSFTYACALAEIKADRALAVEVDGEDVAVVRSGDEYYAIADLCSHAAVARSFGVRVVSEPHQGVCPARQRGYRRQRV